MAFAGIAFILSIIIGVPIAFVLGITGTLHVASIDPNLISVIPQRIFAGVNSSSLSAIPFFIIAGELMNGSGVTEKLLGFVRNLIGWIKGGLGYATILIAAILSAVLGSPNAVSSILCKTMIPALKEDGYEKEFSGALIAAAGVIDIIPPSSMLVIFAVVGGLSIQTLFAAAIIPGLLIGVGYAIVVAIYIRRNKLTNNNFSFSGKRLVISFGAAIPALLVPTVMIGGTMSGIFTPTESGAVACVAAILAGIIYKSFDFKQLPAMLGKATCSSAVILFIIAMGNIMGYSMATDNIPAKISDTIFTVTSNPTIIMLMMLAVLIVVGCLMEATAGIMIFAPVMIPIAHAIGVDGIHFGLVFVLMMSIALITPPVGMLLFVTSNVSQLPVTRIINRIMPFVVIAFAITFILAFVPDIVLIIPRLMGYNG